MNEWLLIRVENNKVAPFVRMFLRDLFAADASKHVLMRERMKWEDIWFQNNNNSLNILINPFP